jgi:hypothetical protein
MSSDPTEVPQAKWYTPLKPYLPWLIRIAVAFAIAAATHYGWPPEVVQIIKEVPIAVVQQDLQPELTEFSPTQGWIRDADAIAANLDETKTLHFERTPAGKVALGDEDVFLWRAVRKVNNRGPPWYPNVNQESVGCCVGCGWKHSADIVQATAIASGKRFEWKPVSVEVIYAGSRVDVGRGQISGDGSMGAWAREWSQSQGGIAAMQKYDSVDLSKFSPARARDWGRRGIPPDVAAAAKEHPVKGCALVKSWADVKRAIQQGYPVAVCSDQGFTMGRDATGRARPQGSWSHCMCICAVRTAADGHTEGAFILNSWGDNAHTGPVWPEDAPVAGFWADAAVVDRMVKQGDSFALADVAGFPARKVLPDWFVREVQPERFRPRDPFVFKREFAQCSLAF